MREVHHFPVCECGKKLGFSEDPIWQASHQDDIFQRSPCFSEASQNSDIYIYRERDTERERERENEMSQNTT